MVHFQNERNDLFILHPEEIIPNQLYLYLLQDELKTLKERRVAAFQKCLTELAELELKHSKAHAQMLRAAVASLKAEL